MKQVRRRQSYDPSSVAPLGRGRRAVLSWLSLAVLLVNLLGGLALPRTGAAAPGFVAAVPGFVRALSQDHIVICTAFGMVEMDRDGHRTDSGSGGIAHGEFCPFCLPLMQGGVQLPASLALAAPPALDETPSVFPPGFLWLPSPIERGGAAAPRAPPFS